MALYFITGISGSGKSTVLSKLREHGYEAYDVDEVGPAVAKWHHNTTGFVHPKSSVKAADRTPEFLANHSWRVPRDEVTALRDSAQPKTVFLGGSIANEAELLDLFTDVFALAIDDETLQQRIAARTNNDWGKQAHELAATLKTNRKLHEQYQWHNYQIIDASKPIDAVVDEIVSNIHDN